MINSIFNCYEQDGVEAGAATKQRHQGPVLALGFLAGEVAMTGVIVTITDREEMVSIDQVPGKTEGSQAPKYQEVDKMPQSPLIRKF